jgi:Rrf2 family protein
MRVSAKAEYACVAVLQLAGRPDREPVRLGEIAGPNHIPERFLVQILLQLKGAGIVGSTRGSAGGYWLAVDPGELSLWDVIQCIDAPSAPAPADQADRDSPAWRVLTEAWRNVFENEVALLRQIDFGQLVHRASESGVDMFYI